MPFHFKLALLGQVIVLKEHHSLSFHMSCQQIRALKRFLTVWPIALEERLGVVVSLVSLSMFSSSEDLELVLLGKSHNGMERVYLGTTWVLTGVHLLALLCFADAMGCRSVGYLASRVLDRWSRRSSL